MSSKDRVKATAKNIEGKIQETYGDVIGSPKDQSEGKAKQMDAKVKHTVEDVKDEVKKIVD
ncbi:CsbD family protein [Cyanobacterium aponinum UTEX 3221]|uniref:CsbD family protein n=1 Tax=Cyanobacterium aponinum TaxID=379064 RepID=UPI002B4C1F73|nr:CsbD family protein [Cyanobacterium aponinum]WRL39079.1 CsbD family protein [Cyanobacterium aponinum UTEX 3221]